MPRNYSWLWNEGDTAFAVVAEDNALPSIYKTVTRIHPMRWPAVVLLELVAGQARNDLRIGGVLIHLDPHGERTPRDIFPTLEDAYARAQQITAMRYAELSKMLGMAHIGHHVVQLELPDSVTLVVLRHGKMVTLAPVDGDLQLTVTEINHE